MGIEGPGDNAPKNLQDEVKNLKETVDAARQDLEAQSNAERDQFTNELIGDIEGAAETALIEGIDLLRDEIENSGLEVHLEAELAEAGFTEENGYSQADVERIVAEINYLGADSDGPQPLGLARPEDAGRAEPLGLARPGEGGSFIELGVGADVKTLDSLAGKPAEEIKAMLTDPEFPSIPTINGPVSLATLSHIDGYQDFIDNVSQAISEGNITKITQEADTFVQAAREQLLKGDGELTRLGEIPEGMVRAVNERFDDWFSDNPELIDLVKDIPNLMTIMGQRLPESGAAYAKSWPDRGAAMALIQGLKEQFPESGIPADMDGSDRASFLSLIGRLGVEGGKLVLGEGGAEMSPDSARLTELLQSGDKDALSNWFYDTDAKEVADTILGLRDFTGTEQLFAEQLNGFGDIPDGEVALTFLVEEMQAVQAEHPKDLPKAYFKGREKSVPRYAEYIINKYGENLDLPSDFQLTNENVDTVIAAAVRLNSGDSNPEGGSNGFLELGVGSPDGLPDLAELRGKPREEVRVAIIEAFYVPAAEQLGVDPSKIESLPGMTEAIDSFVDVIKEGGDLDKPFEVFYKALEKEYPDAFRGLDLESLGVDSYREAIIALGEIGREGSEQTNKTPEQRLDAILEGLDGVLPPRYLDQIKPGGTWESVRDKTLQVVQNPSYSDAGAENYLLQRAYQTFINESANKGLKPKIEAVPGFDPQQSEHLRALFKQVTEAEASGGELNMDTFKQDIDKLSRGNADKIDVDRMPEFKFSEQDLAQIEGLTGDNKERMIRVKIIEKMTSGLLDQYNDWLEEHVTEKSDGEEAEEGINNIMNVLSSRGSRSFPADLTNLLGTGMSKELQNVKEHSKAQLTALAEKEITKRVVEHVNSLESHQLQEMINRGKPLDLVDSLKTRSEKELASMAKDLGTQLKGLTEGTPEYTEVKAKLTQVNSARVYRHAMENGVPKWATNFGEPNYAEAFGQYIRSEKAMIKQDLGSPDFNLGNVNAGEMWNDWFEGVQAEKEDGFTSLRRALHILLTFLREIGLLKEEEGEKDPKEEFLKKEGLLLTPEQQRDNLAKDITKNWGSNKIEGLDSSTDTALQAGLVERFPTIGELEEFNTKVLQPTEGPVKELRSQNLTPEQLLFVAQNSEDIDYAHPTVTINISEGSPALSYDISTPDGKQEFKDALENIRTNGGDPETFTDLAANQSLDTWRESNPDKIPDDMTGAQLLDLGLYIHNTTDDDPKGSFAWSEQMGNLLSTKDSFWEPKPGSDHIRVLAQAMEAGEIELNPDASTYQNQTEIKARVGEDTNARTFDSIVDLSEALAPKTKEFHAKNHEQIEDRLPKGITLAELEEFGLIEGSTTDKPAAPETDGEEGSEEPAESTTEKAPESGEGMQWHKEFYDELVNSDEVWKDKPPSKEELDFIGKGIKSDPDGFIDRYKNFDTKFSDKLAGTEMHEVKAAGLVDENGAPEEKLEVLVGSDFDGELDDGMPMKEFWRSTLTPGDTQKFFKALTADIESLKVSNFGDNEIHVTYKDEETADYDTIKELIDEDANIF